MEVRSFIALILSVLLGISSCTGVSRPDTIIENEGGTGDMKELPEFDIITISEIGTEASTREYEIVRTDGGVTVSFYYGPWNFNEATKREDCLTNRIEGGDELYGSLRELVRDCKVEKWNGFSKSNPNVLDGSSFWLSGVINGKEVSAHGSNAYPDGYSDFTRALWKMLNEQ